MGQDLTDTSGRMNTIGYYNVDIVLPPATGKWFFDAVANLAVPHHAASMTFNGRPGSIPSSPDGQNPIARRMPVTDINKHEGLVFWSASKDVMDFNMVPLGTHWDVRYERTDQPSVTVESHEDTFDATGTSISMEARERG
eukprot:4017537-Amphidinium_carterae.1